MLNGNINCKQRNDEESAYDELKRNGLRLCLMCKLMVEIVDVWFEFEIISVFVQCLDTLQLECDNFTCKFNKFRNFYYWILIFSTLYIFYLFMDHFFFFYNYDY